MKQVARIMVLGIAIAVFGNTAAFAAKTTIGIPEFENKAGVRYRISDTLVDMLTTILVRSGKFEVVERTQLNKVVQEQDLGASGLVEPGSAAQHGKLRGADYMLFGIVTECGGSTTDAQAYGIRTVTNAVYLAVDIRFVDSSTGSTLYADTFRKVDSARGTATATSYLDVRAGIGHSMARSVIDTIAQRTMTSVYPPKVIKVSEGGEVILNYGEALFSVGDRWDVYTKGESLIDPDTGEDLGSDDTKVGRIRISSTTLKTSKGTIESGAVSAGDICREAPKTRKAAPKREKVNPF
jgi:curli biogenesis system outer membrane secretion channel CsgG